MAEQHCAVAISLCTGSVQTSPGSRQGLKWRWHLGILDDTGIKYCIWRCAAQLPEALQVQSEVLVGPGAGIAAAARAVDRRRLAQLEIAIGFCHLRPGRLPQLLLPLRTLLMQSAWTKG